MTTCAVIVGMMGLLAIGMVVVMIMGVFNICSRLPGAGGK